LAEELYAGASLNEGGAVQQVVVQGVEGYALKNLKDHMALAHDVVDAFEKKKSKANFQVKFVKEVTNQIFFSISPALKL
jgi:hypothetical protein